MSEYELPQRKAEAGRISYHSLRASSGASHEDFGGLLVFGIQNSPKTNRSNLGLCSYVRSLFGLSIVGRGF